MSVNRIKHWTHEHVGFCCTLNINERKKLSIDKLKTVELKGQTELSCIRFAPGCQESLFEDLQKQAFFPPLFS